jgi:hypothetical protein
VASEAVRQSGSIEVQVAELGAPLPAGDWPTLAPVAGRATAADVFGQRIGRFVAIRARAVNTLGMRGPWRQITHLVAGRRAPVVWRQATAPGGATLQDGDEWVDTDDGNRRYLRVAGAWVDMPVGTGGLAPGAATQVDEFTGADVEITGASGSGLFGYSATFRWTPIASIVFTASVTGQAVLHMALQAEYRDVGSIEPDLLLCELKINVDFDNDNVVDFGGAAEETVITDFARTLEAPGNVARSVALSRVMSRPVVAGTAYTWNVYGQKLEGTVFVRRFYARVEQIKR